MFQGSLGKWTSIGAFAHGIDTLWVAAASNIYVVDLSVQCEVQHFIGGTWRAEAVASCGEDGVLRLWGSGPTDVYALVSGTHAGLYHSSGNGLWSMQAPLEFTPASALWGESPSDFYAFDNERRDARLFHLAMPASSWNMEAEVNAELGDVGGTLTDVYAVGNAPESGCTSVILHRAANASWKQERADYNSQLLTTWGTQNVQYAGGEGVILRRGP